MEKPTASLATMLSKEAERVRDSARVLLVEDNPEEAALFSVLLKRGPKTPSFTVDTAARLEEALLLAGRDHPDVVLLDLSLPDAQGLEAVEAFLREFPALPLVVFTGLEDEATAIRALEKGAQDYLVKSKVDERLLHRSIRYSVKRQEQRARLHASWVFLQTMLDAVPAALGVLDSQGVLLGANAAWLNEEDPALPFGRHRKVGTNYLDFCARAPLALQPLAGQVASEITKILKDGGPEFWEEVAFPPLQPERWFYLRIRTIPGSEGDRVLLIFVDISERKRAQLERERLHIQLLQSQKMQALGQLAAGVAHEINNPTGYILSNLGTVREYLEDIERFVRSALDARGEERLAALDRLAGELDLSFVLQDAKKAIEECQGGAQRISKIVHGLRDFVHVDEGKPQQADLRDCLEGAIRLCWNELKYKADVQRDYAESPPLRCYPQALSQVFVNLLINGAQAIEDRGRITVTVRPEGEEAVVRIRDSGRGIPPAAIPKIFEPFFTTKAVGHGTGLGLHVALKIVRAHGGKIDVSSEEGNGTEMTVRLPLSGPPDRDERTRVTSILLGEHRPES